MLAGENNKNHKHKPEHCASTQALQQRTEEEWSLKNTQVIRGSGHRRVTGGKDQRKREGNTSCNWTKGLKAHIIKD